jgi:hypothetical protein
MGIPNSERLNQQRKAFIIFVAIVGAIGVITVTIGIKHGELDPKSAIAGRWRRNFTTTEANLPDPNIVKEFRPDGTETMSIGEREADEFNGTYNIDGNVLHEDLRHSAGRLFPVATWNRTPRVTIRRVFNSDHTESFIMTLTYSEARLEEYRRIP